MTVLVVQVDVRLRKLTPEGLEDVVSTFTHYDLPLSAAGGDWGHGERERTEVNALRHFGEVLAQTVPQLLDHCQFEQAELPFG